MISRELELVQFVGEGLSLSDPVFSVPSNKR